MDNILGVSYPGVLHPVVSHGAPERLTEADQNWLQCRLVLILMLMLMLMLMFLGACGVSSTRPRQGRCARHEGSWADHRKGLMQHLHKRTGTERENIAK